jgi:hypothetical protein
VQELVTDDSLDVRLRVAMLADEREVDEQSRSALDRKSVV